MATRHKHKANHRVLVKKSSKSFAATAKKMKDRELAKAKGKEAAAITKLAPIAKEINERLVKAEKMTSDAFNHRLSAAIRLEDANKMCKKSGVNFKKWVEANVTQSYETVRKLVAVGAADDPKLALEDLRLNTKKRVAKHRAKVAADPVLRNTIDGERSKVSPSSSGPARTAWEIAEDMVAHLPEKEQISLVEARAHLLGRKVITANDAELLRSSKSPSKVSPTVSSMKMVFMNLKASDKMVFLRWAAAEVGATVQSSLINGSDDRPIPEKGGIDVPPSMRR